MPVNITMPKIPTTIRLRGGLPAGEPAAIHAWPKCQVCGSTVRITNGVVHCPVCEPKP